MALGTCTKIQLEILAIDVISDIVYFREIILESSRNVSETTPWIHSLAFFRENSCWYCLKKVLERSWKNHQFHSQISECTMPLLYIVFVSQKDNQSHLTHWGWMTLISVLNLTIIGSDYGLSPGRRQAIIWTSDIILSIRLLGTNLSGILIKIHKFSFKKMHLKMCVAKWRQSWDSLNVLTWLPPVLH